MSQQDFTPNLQQALKSINELQKHIEQFNLDDLMYHAPIIDRIKSEPWKQDEIMGYKKWVDGIWNHEGLLRAMIESGIPPKDDPLPTVSNLVTFWKIIITSKTPIVGIKMGMGGDRRLSNGYGIGNTNIPSSNYQKSEKCNGGSKKGTQQKKKLEQKEKEVWVDVIAQGGREWIRIYSKKISHLLAEFREADSYINSDYDSDSSSSTSASSSKSTSSKNKSKEPAGMDNSLITAAKDLLRAASLVDRIPGAPIPKITIHLTRIPSTPKELYEDSNPSGYPQHADDDGKEEELDWPDDRIPLTFDELREMGVNLIFGDLSNIPLSPSSSSSTATQNSKPLKPLEPIPSLKLNLDITTLMGLCSDVLHYPLPRSKGEAASRSLRPIDQLVGNGNTTGRGRDGTGKGKNKSSREEEFENSPEIRGQSQNSVELYRCILEEMERPFIDEFNQIIKNAIRDQSRRQQQRSLRDQTDSGNEEPSKSLSNLDLNTETKVEFWTTKEAAQYTYEALSSGPAHGEGYEQKRMRIMLGLEEGDFFETSRYDSESKQGYLRNLKVNIFDLEDDKGNAFKPRSVKQVLQDAKERGELQVKHNEITSKKEHSSDGRDINNSDTSMNGDDKTGFHQTLSSITELFLDQYYSSLINLQPSDINTPTTKPNKPFASISSNNLPNFLQPRKLPTPPIAKISLPFPVVSLHSLNMGSKEGMTTIMMGTATLKEVWGQTLWRIRGWERGWYNWDHPTQSDNRDREKGFAAVMIFPYRVFGEGKRVRFSKGDYSYPTKDWWETDTEIHTNGENVAQIAEPQE